MNDFNKESYLNLMAVVEINVTIIIKRNKI